MIPRRQFTASAPLLAASALAVSGCSSEPASNGDAVVAEHTGPRAHGHVLRQAEDAAADDRADHQRDQQAQAELALLGSDGHRRGGFGGTAARDGGNDIGWHGLDQSAVFVGQKLGVRNADVCTVALSRSHALAAFGHPVGPGRGPVCATSSVS